MNNLKDPREKIVMRLRTFPSSFCEAIFVHFRRLFSFFGAKLKQKGSQNLERDVVKCILNELK